ncbi:MAG: methyltransferase [Tissierellia bacterium]|nr:methyltransferase [Tissierellia bacterium]
MNKEINILRSGNHTKEWLGEKQFTPLSLSKERAIAGKHTLIVQGAKHSLASIATMGSCRKDILLEDQKKKEETLQSMASKYPGVDYRGLHIPKATLFYRNKMEYTFGDQVKGGPLQLGLHEKGKFHNIIEDTDWPLIPYDFIRIRRHVRKFFAKRNLDFYHRWNHKGLLRHLVIRHSVAEDAYLLNLVTTSEEALPKDFVDHMLSLSMEGEIKSIYHTINDSTGDAITAEEVYHLYGAKTIQEEVVGLRFPIGPFSFFQTNSKAAEELYTYVREQVESVDLLWDLYAGSAVLGSILSPKAKKIYSVEINPANIEDGKQVLEINDIHNVELVLADCKEFVKREDKADMIVIDPPRMGLHPKVRESLNQSGVKQILYVSCNPKTMHIDMQEMTQYRVCRLKGFYNFAATKHMEAVALLEKRDS